jgi:heme/copper-type cytochrome/quinol oxidase subunit 3
MREPQWFGYQWHLPNIAIQANAVVLEAKRPMENKASSLSWYWHFVRVSST